MPKLCQNDTNVSLKTSVAFWHIKSLNLWKKSSHSKENITYLYMRLLTNIPSSVNVTTFSTYQTIKKNGTIYCTLQATVFTLALMYGTKPTISVRSSAQSVSVRSAAELRDLREVKI